MGKAMSGMSLGPQEGILHHLESVDLIPSNIELSGIDERKQRNADGKRPIKKPAFLKENRYKKAQFLGELNIRSHVNRITVKLKRFSE
jgi:hypothetical protein